MTYRFATDVQWNACLFVQARRADGGIRPFAPYVLPPAVLESNGAFAPAVNRTRRLFWRDDDGMLHRQSDCGGDTFETLRAPVAIAQASRIVAAAGGLWVIDPPGSLQLFEEESLTRLLTVDVPDAEIVDITGGGHDAIFALLKRGKAWQAVRTDRAGHLGQPVAFEGIRNATAFVFLRRSKRFVVLAGPETNRRLYWFASEGGDALFSVPVAGMRPCFEAGILGSDGSDRVFLANDVVVMLDADGNSLGEISLDAPATGIAANRDSLFVTTRRGLLHFNASEVVSENTAPVRCMLVTPVLFSPDREDQRRWLRVEATTSLPEGSTLEISWAATDDTATRDRLHEMMTNSSIRASLRVQQLMRDPDLRRGTTVFHGSSAVGQGTKTPFSAKLFDVSERHLWVCITLSAAAGGRLPNLSQLSVLYPGRTLMEDLPSIYQREESRPDSFLRALVGVLETTTQDLDGRIASMGRQLHPSTASEPWLDFIARWLGVPWDDGMSLTQKKAVVSRAAELARTRGTRAGLEALLESLIPDKPRRFRVTDATADFGFAMVGGDSCTGSSLPAMLGGRTRWSPQLDSRAILGHLRLPCPGQREDGAWQLTGRVRVDVAATAAEKKAWQPWLVDLIKEMVPLTARVELRWVSAQSLRSNRLDGTMTIEPRPMAHLGTDAITSLARLPAGETRLSSFGPVTGTRLR